MKKADDVNAALSALAIKTKRQNDGVYSGVYKGVKFIVWQSNQTIYTTHARKDGSSFASSCIDRSWSYNIDRVGVAHGAGTKRQALMMVKKAIDRISQMV